MSDPETGPACITRGWRPGLLGDAAALQSRTYAQLSGFGAAFEAVLARGLGEFAARLDRPGNAIWSAHRGDLTLGTIAIDGEDMGPGVAHLRWFVVAPGLRGGGIGRRLLTAALDFVDAGGFAETQLWTFQGLDAARRLYEAAGFRLTEERPGAQWGSTVQEQRFVRYRSSPR